MHTCFTLQTHLVMFKITSLENTEEHTWKRHGENTSDRAAGMLVSVARIPQSNFQPLLHMHMKATGIRS